MKTEKYILPAYWASYLINGDGSGLTAAEADQIESWLESEGNPAFVDVGDSWFSNTIWGNVAEYTAIV